MKVSCTVGTVIPKTTMVTVPHRFHILIGVIIFRNVLVGCKYTVSFNPTENLSVFRCVMLLFVNFEFVSQTTVLCSRNQQQ